MICRHASCVIEMRKVADAPRIHTVATRQTDSSRAHPDENPIWNGPEGSQNEVFRNAWEKDGPPRQFPSRLILNQRQLRPPQGKKKTAKKKKDEESFDSGTRPF
ncbi:hypothetical protein TNIN_454901 [Trichonephila inaurata madagascariensis]|uniref:Uncharacterized protein n=1 Tax=Trichonephila inaurata madagascariensis TaxID=2747483 RepID=A0A8X7BNQ3_9ARAC|nr:hypothetical protein TNIN_454901 [Trichonephila inaurata madagascariensis]